MSYHGDVRIYLHGGIHSYIAHVTVREEHRKRDYWIGKGDRLTIDRSLLIKFVKQHLSRDDVAVIWNEMGFEQEQAIKEAYDNWNMTEECMP